MKRVLLLALALPFLSACASGGKIKIPAIPDGFVPEECRDLVDQLDKALCIAKHAGPKPNPRPAPRPRATPTTATPSPAATATSAPAATTTAAPTTSSFYKPPTLWFWRGIKQANLTDWRANGNRSCADFDTTEWMKGRMAPGCVGAPSCDSDHFPCAGEICSWRGADDPRGPQLVYQGHEIPACGEGVAGPCLFAKKGSHGGTVCAPAGAVVSIDTCPRPGFHTCADADTDYSCERPDPRNADGQICHDGRGCKACIPCVQVPMPIEGSGCYSTVENVEIRF